MSKEINSTINLNVKNGLWGFNMAVSTVIDQAVLGAHEPIVFVGTSEEDMPVGDVVTPGILVLRNLDPTNYVTWGPKSAGVMVAIGRLNPGGEPAQIRMDPSATLRWKANNAECKVEMHLLAN